MNQKHIIKFEQGTLYLKLRESFNTDRMEVHCTLAQVTRDAVKVVKADSRGEVSSTSMSLITKEMALLTEGVEMVRKFWEESPLPYQYVLLDCGCSIEWGKDDLPFIDNWAWCENHEEQRILRFNIPDFIGETEAASEGA